MSVDDQGSVVGDVYRDGSVIEDVEDIGDVRESVDGGRSDGKTEARDKENEPPDEGGFAGEHVESDGDFCGVTRLLQCKRVVAV